MSAPSAPSVPGAAQPAVPTVGARPIIVWDIALSAVVLVFSIIVLVVSSFIDLFSAAFIGDCPLHTCSAGSAVSALGISWFAMFVIVIMATVLAILRMVRRRRSWWVTVLALVLIVAIWIIGYVLFFQAVHHLPPELDGFVALGFATPAG